MKTDAKSGILVVDGDEAHAKMIAEKLNFHGVHSAHTPNPNEVMGLLKSDNFDILLSEVKLPGTSGFELAHEVRDERNAKPEIILMSSDPKVTLFECHQAGACYLVKKPVNFDELGLVLKRFGNVDQIAADAKQDSAAALGRLYGQIRVIKQKHEFPIEVSNLGRGGFFCKTSSGLTPPPVGQVVDFNLKLGMVPDCQCSGRGIIRWSYQTMLGDNGVGIEFLKVPEWFHQVAYAFADLFKVTPFIPNV